MKKQIVTIIGLLFIAAAMAYATCETIEEIADLYCNASVANQTIEVPVTQIIEDCNVPEFIPANVTENGTVLIFCNNTVETPIIPEENNTNESSENETTQIEEPVPTTGNSGSGGGRRQISDFISIDKGDYTSKEQVQESIDQLHLLYKGSLSTQQRMIYEQKLQALEALLETFTDEITEEDEIKEEEEDETGLLRNALELAADTILSEQVMETLRNVKIINRPHYDTVIEIAKNAQEDQKVVLVEELVFMDPEFTDRLLSQGDIEEQTYNYVNSVKRGVQSKEGVLNEQRVQDIFDGDASLDDVLDFLNSPPRFSITSGSGE